MARKLTRNRTHVTRIIATQAALCEAMQFHSWSLNSQKALQLTCFSFFCSRLAALRNGMARVCGWQISTAILLPSCGLPDGSQKAGKAQNGRLSGGLLFSP